MQFPLRFRPSLFDALRGYSREQLLRDVGAGATVGVVALPLAMAFAMASGLKPEAGLITAIVAGFLISALGGSRVQIGGPAGAFIVIVYGIVQHHGVAGLIAATALSGLLLFAMGLLRLGTLIRFIPIAVVIGFTNGIAVLILLSQIKDFFGLQVTHMPADFAGMLRALWQSLPTTHLPTLAVAAGSLALIVGWQQAMPRLAPRAQFSGQLSRVPGSIVALVLATLAVALLELPVQTIGSRFGGIPSTLPAPHWPAFAWDGLRALLMPAFTLALLGAIESLLCARIADGLTGQRHDPNQELMAQGVANVVTPFFGGMPATGTIARTITNVKSGASSPVAGMVHAVALLGVVLLAAPLAAHVPLAALAAILVYVAWNMGEWREFAHLRQYRMPYRVTLLAVFVLTVVVDLTVAVEVGLVAACLTFIYRISSLSQAEHINATEQPLLQGLEGRVAAQRFHGVLFFGAVKQLEELERHLPSQALVLDLAHVIYVDSTGADSLFDLLHHCQRQGVRLILCGLRQQPLDLARRCGLLGQLPATDLCPDLEAGLRAARAALA